MDRSDDDPFGWYSGMKSLRSIHHISKGVAQVWAEEEEPQPPAHRSTRYDKIALLGQGGMGQVWLGWDVMLERHVAIKEPYESGRKRLRREAMLMAQLEHPGIVKIHDIYQEDGHELFVMQLVPGAPLGELLVDRSVPIEQASVVRLVRHVLQACEALAHAHAQRLLHGDLSPRNIMIAPDGATHIIDWGLARPLDEDASHSALASKVGVAGTPGFLAPELLEGNPVGLATDVWSIGALLHTILYGDPPDGERLVETSGGDRSQRALAAITARCLDHDPTQRYAHAGELAQELEAWFEGRRLSAYSPSFGELLAQTLRAHRALTITSLTFSVVLMVVIAGGLILTSREAERARHAEQLARQEAEQARRVLLLAYISQAKQALAERDTSLALEQIAHGLRLSDHPELRGLLLKLWAISTPKLVAREPLPEVCQQHALIIPPGDALLCFDHKNFSASLHQHGEEIWRYEPRVDLLRQLSSREPFDDEAFRRMYVETPFDPVSYFKIHRFIDARGSDETIELLDHMRFLHRIDRRTGKLTSFDVRLGKFAFTQEQGRVSWSDETPLDEGLAPSPCREMRGGMLARPSRHSAELSTYYLCGDGSLWLSRVDTSTKLLPAGSGVDAMLTHSDRGELYLANRAGTIWRHGQAHAPLLGHFSPLDLLEVEGTPYVLVRGLEGELKLFDHRTMQWSASLLGGASAAYVGKNQQISVIRQGALERWQLSTRPRLERYHGEHGFASLGWSKHGELLAGVDGGGYLHVVDPLRDRVSSPQSLTTHVIKSVAPGATARTFQLAMISMGEHHNVSVELGEGDRHLTVHTHTRERERVSLRRTAVLSSGAIYELSYSNTLLIQPAGERDDLVKLSAATSFLDVSVTPAQDALLVVSEEELWRFTPAAPLTPERLEVELPEEPVGVALRHDHSFALWNNDEVRWYTRDGEQLGAHKLERQALDMQWHPQRPWLLMSFMDGSLEVHESNHGSLRLLARIKDHRARASGVSVHPAGRWAATSSWDNTLGLYDLEPLERDREELIAQIEQML